MDDINIKYLLIMRGAVMNKLMDSDAKSTREKILETAINMFSERGYNNVSIREIAKEVGIKGSSIYNHFKSKEDILDSILQYNSNIGKDNYESSSVYENIEQLISNMSLEEILMSAMKVSISFMNTESIDKIFKIISAEQLNNDKVRAFFLEEYIEQPRRVLEKVFHKLAAQGKIKGFSAEMLADEFYSFIIFKYYENYLLRKNTCLDFEKMQLEFSRHIKFFSTIVSKE